MSQIYVAYLSIFQIYMIFTKSSLQTKDKIKHIRLPDV